MNRRSTASRAPVARQIEASSGYRRGHRGISSGMLPVEGIQKLLRNMVERAANGCVGQVRESEPLVALPCELGIERDGTEAGDSQARDPARSRVGGFGRDK